MGGPAFNTEFRSALQGARDEASALGHGHVDTTHLLLSVMRRPSAVLTELLNSLAVDPSNLAREAGSALQNHHAPPLSDIGFPYTGPAKKALESAMDEARQLRHADVGPEHLLLALLRVGSPADSLILSPAGITLDKTRAALSQLRAPSLQRPFSRALIVALPLSLGLPVSVFHLMGGLGVPVVGVALECGRKPRRLTSA